MRVFLNFSYTFLDQNYGNSFREVLKELDLSATLKGLVLLDINFGTFVGEMRLAYLRNSNNFETKESINNIILEKIRFFLTNRFEVIWELEIEDNIINKFRYLNLFFSEPYKRTQLQSNSIYMSVLNNFYFDFNLKSEIDIKIQILNKFIKSDDLSSIKIFFKEEYIIKSLNQILFSDMEQNFQSFSTIENINGEIDILINLANSILIEKEKKEETYKNYREELEKIITNRKNGNYNLKKQNIFPDLDNLYWTSILKIGDYYYRELIEFIKASNYSKIKSFTQSERTKIAYIFNYHRRANSNFIINAIDDIYKNNTLFSIGKEYYYNLFKKADEINSYFNLEIEKTYTFTGESAFSLYYKTKDNFLIDFSEKYIDVQRELILKTYDNNFFQDWKGSFRIFYIDDEYIPILKNNLVIIVGTQGEFKECTFYDPDKKTLLGERYLKVIQIYPTIGFY